MAEAPESRTQKYSRKLLITKACHLTCHVLGLILLLQAPVSAQPTTAQLLKIIEVQQKQIDILQARLDGSETFSRVTIDWLSIGQDSILVQGWGFACGQPDGGRLVVVVDGVQSAQATKDNFFRWPRYDVLNEPNAELCTRVLSYVPTVTAGFQTLVGMEPFEHQPANHVHKITVRIFDKYGRVRDSDPVEIRYDAKTGQHWRRE